MEERFLRVMKEHGPDTIPKLSKLAGVSEMQSRRMIGILMGEGKIACDQVNGIRRYRNGTEED